jgi:hypothetical protein
MLRYIGLGLLALLLGAAGLGLAWTAHALTWTKVTVGSTGDVGQYSSIALNASGDAMVAYHDETRGSLRFSWCDMSTSGCTQWLGGEEVYDKGDYISIAADPNGDPMISYHWAFLGSNALRFSWCDMSATGGCDQAADWIDTDVGNGMVAYTSIAVDANGDPMISYYDQGSTLLGFARCDMSATDGCDGTADWTRTIVDDDEVAYTSIAVDANGDPMISYYNLGDENLEFARCDMSASGGCDQTTDWTTTIVDSIGAFTSIAVDANGDPMIAYYNTDLPNLKFAWCDMSATGCDQLADWTKATVDPNWSPGVGQYSSIAVDGNGDPMISYYDSTHRDLMFVTCDMDTLCDQTVDWSANIVRLDEDGDVGQYTSIAVDPTGNPAISYYDVTNGDLRYVRANSSVGGIAEWPGTDAGSGSVAGSPAGSRLNYVALGAAVSGVMAVTALAAGAWLARRWAR